MRLMCYLILMLIAIDMNAPIWFYIIMIGMWFMDTKDL